MLAQKSLRLFVLSALGALVPLTAGAQSRPPVEEPPPTNGPNGRERVAPAGAGPALPWAVTLGLLETYDGAPRFEGVEAGRGLWATRVQGGLGRTFALKRGGIDVHGDATQVFYKDESQPDQLMYGASLGAVYAMTRRLTWHVSEGISSTLAQDSAFLTEAGRVFSRRTMTKTILTSTDFAYQSSEKTSMRFEVAQTRVSFNQEALTSGNSTNVRFSFSRQVRPTQAIGVSAGHTFTSGQTGDIQGLLGTWQATLGRHVALNAAAGIRPYKLYGVDGYQFAPGGSFGLAVTFDKQTMNVSYESAVEQAYGVNEALGGGLTHTGKRLNADYGIAIGQRLAFNVAGNYGHNTYPQIEGYHIGGRSVMTTVRYLIARPLSLNAGYAVWWRTETGAPTSSTNRVTFALTYVLGWR